MTQSPVRRTRNRLLIAVACVGAFSIGLWTARELLLSSLSNWLNVGEPLREPVDCVFLLAGGVYHRPFVAAEILTNGYARHGLVSSPTRRPDAVSDLPSEFELASGVLLQAGVKVEQITELPLEGKNSTAGEAAALKRYLDSHPGKTVAIVTDNYHTRRTRFLFRQELGDDALKRMQFVSCPTDRFGPDDWWHHESGIQTYSIECVKFLVVMVQH